MRRTANPWSILLAGGQGSRMEPTIRGWLKEHSRPKQYCAFVGTRTMFEHTLDRMTKLSTTRRVVTVIGRGHRSFIRRWGAGPMVEQPANRGTTAGVFLPAAVILAQDPAATVVVTPTDHFVHPESRFLEYVRAATELVESQPDQLVILGARPDHPAVEYGWIEPVPGVPFNAVGRPLRVRSFFEKPSAAVAKRLVAANGLWSTFVMVAKVRTLWLLGLEHAPEAMLRLQMVAQVLKAMRHGRAAAGHLSLVLEHAYAQMPCTDFSRTILQNAVDRLLVLPMEGVQWSDWGEPERVVGSLASLGKRPAFTGPLPTLSDAVLGGLAMSGLLVEPSWEATGTRPSPTT
jgi:mannose-1-phosphate guanylyltransferase